jgi:hypothetical protein
MDISPVFLHQFHNRTEFVLHRKGNFRGPVLEMTLVLDHSVPAEQMKERVPVLLRYLKQHSEVFRNVRLNVTHWLGDTQIENQTVPFMKLLVDGFFDRYQHIVCDKRIEYLYGYLKFYHARSKLILLVTDGQSHVQDSQAAQEALKPFLDRKLVPVMTGETGMELGQTAYL